MDQEHLANFAAWPSDSRHQNGKKWRAKNAVPPHNIGKENRGKWLLTGPVSWK
jgi:hypothetical protein